MIVDTITATDDRKAIVAPEGDRWTGICLLCPYNAGLWESDWGVRSDLRRHLSECHPPPSMEDRLAEALRAVLGAADTLEARGFIDQRAVLAEYDAQQERSS